MSKIIKMAIGVTVCVLLVATLLVPVVDDLTEPKKYTNPDAIAPYTEIKAGDVFHWTASEMTLNGTTINGSRSGENWIKCDYLLGASNAVWIGKTNNQSQLVQNLIYADITINDDMTATVVLENNNTVGNPVTFNTVPLSWGFVVSNEGDWCQVRYDALDRKVFFNNLDQIYTSGPGGGLTSSKGTTAYHNGVTYENGITFSGVEEVGDNVSTMEFGLGSLVYSFEGHPEDDIRIIVVPSSILSTPPDNPMYDLIEILPFLLIITILLSVAAVVIANRY